MVIKRTFIIKLLLLCLFITLSQFITISLKAQDICDSIKPLCSTSDTTFSSLQSELSLTGDETCFYCLSYGLNNPNWFFMLVESPGQIIFEMNNPENMDLDFMLWGPFYGIANGCDSLKIAGIENNCNYAPEADCSFSPNSYEEVVIDDAVAGEVYILLVTNYTNQDCNITISQSGGTGLLNCEIVFDCSLISISTETSICDLETATCSVSGSIDYTNPPGAGTLIIEDIAAGVSQTFFPPFGISADYTLNGIPCDGTLRSLNAKFSAIPDCELSTLYTSSELECPAAYISSAENPHCYDNISPINIEIDIIGGIPPYDFKLIADGIETEITNYAGPFPYNIPCTSTTTFEVTEVSDRNCEGTPSTPYTQTIFIKPPSRAIKHH